MVKIGIIVTDDAEKWDGDVGLGKYIMKRFNESNENEVSYEIFYAVRRQLPKKKDYFKGFVISGSHYSVNDDVPWINDLKQFVINLTNIPTAERPKLFGICFGHQIIAVALGGKVENRSENKFIFGAENVELEAQLSEEKYFKRIFGEDQSSFKIMQCHGEEVTILPTQAIPVGRSRTCRYEVLKYGMYILSTQGHPEFTVRQMKNIIAPSIRENKLMNEEEIKNSIKSFKNAHTDTMMKMMLNFLISS